jgi:hypothetical protein
VYAQHSGAESCGYGRVRLAGSRPVVQLAHGSHAAYFVAGLRDRTWPDPNDEADGRGERVRPRLVRITERSPEWMRYDGRWGGSRAGWVPGEMDSPRGPRHQLIGVLLRSSHGFESISSRQDIILASRSPSNPGRLSAWAARSGVVPGAADGRLVVAPVNGGH